MVQVAEFPYRRWLGRVLDVIGALLRCESGDPILDVGVYLACGHIDMRKGIRGLAIYGAPGLRRIRSYVSRDACVSVGRWHD